MTGEEREAIRQADAEDARRSRVEHGHPERIEDPAAVAALATILRDTPTPRYLAKTQAAKGGRRHRYETLRDASTARCSTDAP
jgi:hypothetical protein